MTVKGAIEQLKEIRDDKMLPIIFKPYLDKVIETLEMELFK